MDDPIDVSETAPRAGLRWSLYAVLLYWLFHFSTLTLSGLVFRGGIMPSYLWRRALVTLLAIGISVVFVFVLRAMGNWGHGRRIAALILLSAVGAALHTSLNSAFFYWIFPIAEMPMEWAEFGSLFLGFLWVYLALGLVLLAVDNSAVLRARERSLAELQRAVQSAQLRALRYQINPHFLFNTLNSIAALLRGRSVDEAEHMIENLSDFFRNSLLLDPFADIRLEREIELQALYLEIERVRFPDRLAVEIILPDPLRGAMVPSLILQPLVENSIKYAVARSTSCVTITVAAAGENGTLRLIVADHGGNAGAKDDAPVQSTGTGLGNTRSRLIARFGGEATFRTGKSPEGGYRTELCIPLMFEA